jgi:hypothetical protein
MRARAWVRFLHPYLGFKLSVPDKKLASSKLPHLG